MVDNTFLINWGLRYVPHTKTHTTNLWKFVLHIIKGNYKATGPKIQNSPYYARAFYQMVEIYYEAIKKEL